MVARLTPDQKAACSSHVEVKTLFETNFGKNSNQFIVHERTFWSSMHTFLTLKETL